MEQAESFLRKLTRREEKVLRMRFGIGTEPHQVNEIGRGLGIATTSVRRIQRRAVHRLRLLATNDA
jgi:DNA-directed RNA polymerase sigma subunit (sigma70/sigma32)